MSPFCKVPITSGLGEESDVGTTTVSLALCGSSSRDLYTSAHWLKNSGDNNMRRRLSAKNLENKDCFVLCCDKSPKASMSIGQITFVRFVLPS